MLEREVYLTPKCKVRWAKVLEPDYKFKKEGEFSVDLLVPAKEATNILDVMRKAVSEKAEIVKLELRKNQKAKPGENSDDDVKFAPAPFKKEKDEETGEDIYVFPFKRKHEVFSKKHNKTFEFYVDVFDRKGIPWPKDKKIGNGSICQINYEPYTWYMATGEYKGVGCTLQLNAMQVFDHVPYNAQDSVEKYGFEVEESDEDEISTEAGKDDVPF